MSTVDDELDLDGDERKDHDEHGEVVCPECGTSYSGGFKEARLANHRKKEHGVAPSGPKPKKRKTRDAAPRRDRSSRKAKIAQTLVRAVDLYEDRGDGEVGSLAQTIRRDADKIAGFLAAIADRVNPFAVFIDKTMGDGGIVDGALSFAGVFRSLQARVSGRNAERRRLQAIYEQRYQEILEREGEDAANEYTRQVNAGEIAVE